MSMQFDLFTNRATVSSPVAPARSVSAEMATVKKISAETEYRVRTCGK